MIITDLIRKGKSESYKTFVDGEYVCLLEAETIVKNHIKVGMEIDETQFLEIRKESEKLTCWNYALGFVSATQKTKKQVRDKLKEKQFLPESINYAIDKLANYGYINDEYYAKNYILMMSKSKGKNYIKNQLYSKGVSKQIIDDLLSDFEGDKETIETICEKFIKNYEKNQKNKEKLIRRLISKGFLFDEINPVVNMYFGSSDDWN